MHLIKTLKIAMEIAYKFKLYYFRWYWRTLFILTNNFNFSAFIVLINKCAYNDFNLSDETVYETFYETVSGTLLFSEM